MGIKDKLCCNLFFGYLCKNNYKDNDEDNNINNTHTSSGAYFELVQTGYCIKIIQIGGIECTV